MERTRPTNQEKPDKQYTQKELIQELTDKQIKFCHFYIKWYNATQSYIDAYGADMNRDTAGVNGSRLLGIDRIKQYIEYIKQDIAKEVGISKVGLLGILKNIASVNIADVYTDWIKMEDFQQLKENNPEIMQAIQEISTKKQTIVINKELVEVEYVKIKLEDKQKAIDGIFKAMGWNEAEKVDLSGETVTKIDVTQYSKEEKAILLKAARKNEYKD